MEMQNKMQKLIAEVVYTAMEIYESEDYLRLTRIPKLTNFGVLSFYALPILVQIVNETDGEVRKVALETMREIRRIYLEDREIYFQQLSRMRPRSHDGTWN